MKNINIAFFGTSDRSTPILKALKENFNLVICFTKNDALFGRKHELKESGVKTWCKNNNVDFYEISSIKEQTTEIIKIIKERNITLGVVADFKFMIPEDIIITLDSKLINIHFSLLPKYRGASPVQHALLNKEKITGITYLLTTRGMDEGDILFQSIYNIKNDDTSDSIYHTLFSKSGLELTEVIENFVNNNLIPQKQNNADASYCYSKTNPKSTQIDKNDAFVENLLDAKDLDCMVRAYYAWPIAWTKLKYLEKANVFEKEVTLLPHINKELNFKIYSGKLIDSNYQPIKKYKPEIVQVEGKQKSTWDEFLRGYCVK